MSEPMKPVNAEVSRVEGGICFKPIDKTPDFHVGDKFVILDPATWKLFLRLAEFDTRDLTPEFRERAKAALKAAGVEP